MVRVAGCRRQGEEERSASARLGIDPDLPVVVLNDLPAERKAESRAGVALLVVQALEENEDVVEMGRVNPDAVVSDEKPVVIPLGLHAVARL